MTCARARMNQWNTNDDDSDFYVPTAIKDNTGSCYDYVYVSLGGNDQLTTGCQEGNLDNVKNLVTSVLNEVQYGVNVVSFDLTFPMP